MVRGWQEDGKKIAKRGHAGKDESSRELKVPMMASVGMWGSVGGGGVACALRKTRTQYVGVAEAFLRSMGRAANRRRKKWDGQFTHNSIQDLVIS